MFFSLNQLALRNSTAPTRPADRSRLVASSIVSRFSELVKNQRGYWSRIEPSWPASAKRLERVREAGPDLVADVVGQVLGVDPRLGGQLGWQRLAQVLGQPLDLGRLTGHQRVRLDVEGEVGRRPLDPQLGRPPGRQRVVRRVDLDDREPAGVVGQPFLGGVRRIGIEHAPGGHRRVGPRRGPDPDVATRGRRRSGRPRRLRAGPRPDGPHHRGRGRGRGRGPGRASARMRRRALRAGVMRSG